MNTDQNKSISFFIFFLFLFFCLLFKMGKANRVSKNSRVRYFKQKQGVKNKNKRTTKGTSPPPPPTTTTIGTSSPPEQPNEEKRTWVVRALDVLTKVHREYLDLEGNWKEILDLAAELWEKKEQQQQQIQQQQQQLQQQQATFSS